MYKVPPAVQGLCAAKRPLMHNQFWEACCPGVLSSVDGAPKWRAKESCFIPALPLSCSASCMGPDVTVSLGEQVLAVVPRESKGLNELLFLPLGQCCSNTYRAV